jgi:hypothetical protein
MGLYSIEAWLQFEATSTESPFLEKLQEKSTNGVV